MDYVIYNRVSTKEQGDSRLGLEAQERINLSYINSFNGRVIHTFTEITTGTHKAKIKNDFNLNLLLKKRPKLLEAIEYCLSNNATLIVKDLSRLGRSQLLISYLIQRGLNFICSDSPNDSPFILQIKAALYEEEARKISERTKQALESLKARGIKLGHLPTLRWYKGGQATAKIRKEESKENYSHLSQYISNLRNQGLSFASVAEELNINGFQTTTGKTFKPMTIKRILERV